MGNNFVTIIPARGGSKSIPRKNIADFCGKPLIGWSIEQALGGRLVQSVWVSTDDSEIADTARRFGARIIERPAELATDTASSEDALIHAIDYIEKQDSQGATVDGVVFLQATSPLRETSDIDGAIEQFVSEKADSLFSAALLEDYCLWKEEDGTFTSFTFDYMNRGRRQDRKPYYLENGSIYVFKPELLRRNKNRLGGKIVTYLMPFWKSFEIDAADDIDICGYYMTNKIVKKNCSSDEATCRGLELVVYDFDGVMTDNTVSVDQHGVESVVVSRADGLAVGLIRDKGIRQMILTTEKNPVVERRAEKLSLPILRGIDNKAETLAGYCRDNGIDLRNVAYIGNDVNDLEAMQMVGCPVCPSDAAEEIKRISRIILDTPGGSGAVRRFLTHIE